jgi:3-oxoacyl-[acyl-carrier protein] reductase
LSRETLLILGATSDIGCALIRALPENYGTVIAHGCRSMERLNALAKERPDLQLEPVRADLSRLSETHALFEKMSDRGQEPTQFAHLPAPPYALRRWRDTRWDQVQYELDVQVRSFFLALQACLPGMVKRRHGKVVVLLSSVTFDPPPPYLAHYVAAKEALLGLVRSAAAELASKHITVNAVSPGMMPTRFVETLPESVRDAEARRRPSQRLTSPAETVQALRFFLSEASDGVSGTNASVPREVPAP